MRIRIEARGAGILNKPQYPPTTRCPADKRIGRGGELGIVLPTLDINTGEQGRQWFTWAEVKAMDMWKTPVWEAVVTVEEREL